MQLMELVGSKIETLLLAVVIILQLLLIFLILQSQPKLVPEGLVVWRKSQASKEPEKKESLSSDNLWENPPPATGEMKLTIAEFKSKYNRSDRWDEDFVL